MTPSPPKVAIAGHVGRNGGNSGACSGVCQFLPRLKVTNAAAAVKILWGFFSFLDDDCDFVSKMKRPKCLFLCGASPFFVLDARGKRKTFGRSI